MSTSENAITNTPGSAPRKYSPSTFLRCSLLILSLVMCAVLGSSYWYQTRLNQQLNYYSYPWTAHWISSPFPDRQLACFRKTIYVDGMVNHAYIAVAGNNYYKLIVNSSKPEKYFHSGDTSGFQPGSEPSPYTELGMRRHYDAGSIFNIAPLLVPGKNVICIIAETDEDTTPRIAVQGEVTTASTQQIISDDSWKCWPQEQSFGGLQWTTINFPDDRWSDAVDTGQPVTAYVDGDTGAITDPIRGYFITTTQRNRKSPIFLRTTVDCPAGDNSGYIRIAWTSTYDLSINNQVMASTSMIDRYGGNVVKDTSDDAMSRMMGSTGISASPAMSNQTGSTVYVFKNVFHPGRNTIQLTLHGIEVPMFWTIPQAYLDGKVQSTEGTVRFQTDQNWQAFDDASTRPRSPLLLRTPDPLDTRLVTGGGGTMSLSSALDYYLDVAETFLAIFAVVCIISLAAGIAAGGGGVPGVLTRAAASTVLPNVVMGSATIMQWVFTWSPQNEFLSGRTFGAYIFGSGFLLLIINAFAVLIMAKRGSTSTPAFTISSTAVRSFIDKFAYPIAVGTMMIVAAWLYFRGIGNELFIPDEYVSMLAAQGIDDRGIPVYEHSGILYPRSSLYHYTLAAFLALGRHIHYLPITRVPSIIALVALIPLSYIFGRELRSKNVGLAAAAVIAFSPYMEYFAREVRFYSQFAFFTTLLFYILLRSVRNPDQPKYRVGTILAFIGAYLSQQIIVGAVPAIVLVVMYAGQLRLWFRWQTVRWLILAALVVAADLGAYFIWCVTPLPFIDSMAEPLLGVHADYLDTLPSLLIAYVEREQLVLGLLYVGGFVAAIWMMATSRSESDPLPETDRPWPWWKYQFLSVTAASAVTIAILPHPEPRYVSELFPVIALTSTCVAAAIVTRIGQWFAAEVKAPRMSRSIQAVMVIAFAILLISEARPVRSYDETTRHINRDLTTACSYVRGHLQPGDKLMFFTPEVAMIEFGRCDYSYRPAGASLDKYISADGKLRERNSGAVVIDSPDKLRQVMTKDRRVWLVVSPMSALYAGNTGKLAIANFDVAYEDFGTEVLLWDRDRSRYYEYIADHHEDQFDF